MNETAPRVSVITAFLNGEAYLSEAIDSVIAQTYDNWELLLVDDGSREAASSIAKSYATKFPDKIFYLEHPGHMNCGVSPSRNLGIQSARGEYIAVLDADDVWLPEKLIKQVKLLDDNPGVGLVAGTALYWKSWSDGVDQIVRSGHRQDRPIDPPEAAIEIYPLGEASTPCPSDLLLRADAVRSVGGFEETFVYHYQLYEDQGFLAKLTTSMYFHSDQLIKYRIHPASLMARECNNYHLARHYFLEWLDGYLRKHPCPDPRVARALRRALRPYRQPHMHFVMTLPQKVCNRLQRALTSSAQ